MRIQIAALTLGLAAIATGCQETPWSPVPTGEQGSALAVSANSCMEDVWKQHGNTQELNCTANDVRIASAENIRALDGTPLAQCISGQTFSFVADFRVVLTAQTRYDIGLYFATDGDPDGTGAFNGTCSASVIRAKDPITGLGSANFIQLDGAPDQCGDIDAQHNPQVVTVRVDNVLCQDSDGDGKLNLPNCTSWRQPGSNQVCQSTSDAFPGSPSKCNCDIAFNVPIYVEVGSITVQKEVSPAWLPEPGGEFTYTVTTTNSAVYTDVTIDRICDDRYGTIAASGAACPAGSLGTINSTDCTVPLTLAPGASSSCTFKASLIATGPTEDTDTVVVSGQDQNGKSISASDTAQVAITDVPPSAQVIKSFGSLLCSEVRYQVRVTNTDPAEELVLSALSDSSFGDITQVHDSVVGTTCTVPRAIGIGASYDCTFDARFCGSSHTDTVTATLNDNEANVIKKDSNSLNVGVSAGTQ